MRTKHYLAALAQSVAEVAEGVRETNRRLVTLTKETDRRLVALTVAMTEGFASVNARLDVLGEQFVRHTHDGSES